MSKRPEDRLIQSKGEGENLSGQTMGPPCGDRCPGGKHRPRRRGDTGPALLSGKVSPCNDGVPPPAPSSPLPTTAPHSAVHPAEQGRPPPKDGFPASRGRDSGENPAEMSDRRPGGRGAGPHSARQTPLHTAAWDKRLWGGGTQIPKCQTDRCLGETLSTVRLVQSRGVRLNV